MEREMEEVTARGGGMSPVRVGGSVPGSSCSSLEMEETPVLYFLAAPCTRMGSELALRGRVVRLSCPCSSESPLLCCCPSWRPSPALLSAECPVLSSGSTSSAPRSPSGRWSTSHVGMAWMPSLFPSLGALGLGGNTRQGRALFSCQRLGYNGHPVSHPRGPSHSSLNS